MNLFMEGVKVGDIDINLYKSNQNKASSGSGGDGSSHNQSKLNTPSSLNKQEAELINLQEHSNKIDNGNQSEDIDHYDNRPNNINEMINNSFGSERQKQVPHFRESSTNSDIIKPIL